MAGAHMGNDVTVLQGWGQHQGRGPGLEAAVGSEPCLSYPSNRTALLPPWALSACLPVPAEASVTHDLGPGQEGATAGRLLNSMGRALQAKTQQVVPGGVSLFSDADVGRRCDK